jgi:outer membrane protein
MSLKTIVFTGCMSAFVLSGGCRDSETPNQASLDRRSENVSRSITNGESPKTFADLAKGGGDSGKPLALEAAIALALKNDRQIRIARFNVGIAEDRIITARSFFLPRLRVGAGYAWLDKQPGIFNPDNGMEILAGEKAAFRADARLLVPIYDFGATGSRYRQAQLYRMSEVSARQRVRQQVVYQVTEAYFGILKAGRLLQVARKSLEMTQAHLKRAKNFFVEGLVDKRDVLQTELRLAQVKQSLFRAENGQAMAVSGFNIVIGRSINSPTKVLDILVPGKVGLGLKKCFSLAEVHRPELAQLRTRRAMAEAALKAAKAARYPRIFAVGGYDYDSDEYKLRQETWSVGLRVEMDLFSGGSVTAQIRTAEKRRLQATEAYDDLAEGLKLQVKGAWLAAVEASKNLSVTEKAIAQAEENLRINKDQYAENVIAATEVLDAQTLLTNARASRYQALYYLNAAIARLEWAMGTTEKTPGLKNEKVLPGSGPVDTKEGASK